MGVGLVGVRVDVNEELKLWENSKKKSKYTMWLKSYEHFH